MILEVRRMAVTEYDKQNKNITVSNKREKNHVL